MDSSLLLEHRRQRRRGSDQMSDEGPAILAISKRMANVRTAGTCIERVVRTALRQLGVRYTTGASDLPGRPDIVLRKRRVAIFVHGCFWHSHDCAKGRAAPKTNTAFWANKRLATVARDERNRTELRAAQWQVVTIWECETRNDAALRRRLAQELSP
jgi:DNA mismatch endonuclease (patch repair protein)